MYTHSIIICILYVALVSIDAILNFIIDSELILDCGFTPPDNFTCTRVANGSACSYDYFILIGVICFDGNHVVKLLISAFFMHVA